MKSMKTMKIIIIVLLLAVLVVGAYLMSNRLADSLGAGQLATQPAATAPDGTDGTDGTEPEKFPAPDFTVYDLDGAEHRLSDFRGKPIILNFWATWCGFCKMEMPHFQDKHEIYGEDIQFMMVNVTDGVRETVEKASGYIADEGYTFPVFYDVNLEASMAYPTSGLPVTFFIDAEGNFVAQGSGALSAEALQSGIDLLLGEE